MILEQVPSYFLSKLEALGYYPFLAYNQSEEAVKIALSEAQGILIRSNSQVDQSLLEKTPNLKFILRPGSGLENVDLTAVRERNINLINSPEGNSNAVAEHALGMLLGVLHRIPKSFQEVKRGEWLREPNRGTELSELIIGVIGYGNTGSAFIQKLQGLGCQVYVYDKYRNVSEYLPSFAKQASWPELLAKSDVISFHIPYNSETHHFFNMDLIHSLTKPVYIINTSRGKVLDTQALIKGLDEGQVKGACLDVLENEKLESYTAEEQTILNQLMEKNEVLVTPHIAGWSHRSEYAIYTLLLDKMKALMGIKA